ncbi:hypothetical protein [Goodfellowiella coeruleoviolacea]|uniref:ABC-2 family transporter protein n=1 Tax=Goodfellowiella coeruleoviolacea TaxID=334858 RepID=A0AAE3KH71_9PSEU|nr:hypothetical protein [Goodfellowiella coeruleoviolacea]MCP2166537.1 ABC-2 family transporter protein [Goodfellowiella coeruleoviolacea]
MNVRVGARRGAPVGDKPGPAAELRSGAHFADLAWLAWRQHRVVITTTVLVVAAVVVAALALATQANDLAARCDQNGCPPDFVDQRKALVTHARRLLLYGLPVLSGIVAVFWGAPLVSREYEQRTHLLVWLQDVSPRRWLVSKVASLGALVVLLYAVYGVATSSLVRGLKAIRETAVGGGDAIELVLQPFSTTFEAAPSLQVAYALFGFALGVAAGAVARRTLVAVAITLVGFAAVRYVIAEYPRVHFLPPLRRTRLLDAPVDTPPGGFSANVIMGGGHLDAAGNEIPTPAACFDDTGAIASECLRQHGVVSAFYDYQPVAREGTFQLIELGIYLVLTAVLAVVAWRRLRSATAF